jgi:DNA-binding NtrC family response regulator
MPVHRYVRDERSPRSRDSSGLVAIFSGDRPCCVVFPMAGGARDLGREDVYDAGIDDSQVSRAHLRVERDGEQWIVRDVGSRNGTFVDGRQVQSTRHAAPVIRIGRTLLLPVRDCRPFASSVAIRDDSVTGPTLQSLLERVAQQATTRNTLLVHGEPGTGKELIARAFHAASAEPGPFIIVHCAKIPRNIAERVLFGAHRPGDAVPDAPGLVQTAEHGTLYLDEVSDLDAGIQARLVRLIDTRKVTPVDGTAAIPVQVRLCAATTRSLRAEVAAGRFRDDLYLRLGRPELRLPPLRERREEIPWHVERASQAHPGKPAIDAEFVEACLLREWPGNVRELISEVTIAALAATVQRHTSLAVGDLDDEAGRAPQAVPPDDPDDHVPTERAAIDAALAAERGNVARAAARLAMPRSHLRRYIEGQRVDSTPRAR